MTNTITDVVVHVDETLNTAQLKRLEDSIHHLDGVINACNQDNRPHLVTVTYNPDKLSSQDILACVKGQNYHAELIGI